MPKGRAGLETASCSRPHSAPCQASFWPLVGDADPADTWSPKRPRRWGLIPLPVGCLAASLTSTCPDASTPSPTMTVTTKASPDGPSVPMVGGSTWVENPSPGVSVPCLLRQGKKQGWGWEGGTGRAGTGRVPTILSPSAGTFSGRARGQGSRGCRGGWGPCSPAHPRKAGRSGRALICHPWSRCLGVGTRVCGS